MAIDEVLKRKRVPTGCTNKISEVGKSPSVFNLFAEKATFAKNNGHIPRIIHKIWWQGLDAMPEKYSAPMASWTEMNPNWNIWVWDEQAILKMMRTYFPQYIDMFLSYPRMIQKIDAAKYFLLSQFGGCYSDMDQHCLNPLNQIVDAENEHTEMICSSLTEKKSLIVLSSSFRLRHGPYINNAFIICKPAARVWKHVFDELVLRHKHHFLVDEVKVVVTTGPVCFTRGIKKAMAEERKHNTSSNKSWENGNYTTARFVDSKTIDPFSVYFKMGKKSNFESILNHVVSQNEAICISYEASSWTNGHGSWYSPVINRIVHYLHKDDIKSITKAGSCKYFEDGDSQQSSDASVRSQPGIRKTYSWPKLNVPAYRPFRGKVKSSFFKGRIYKGKKGASF
mmetsp:Transcript_859/g.938  ORF Transcript_859/g.938 Transcript_859/m.938 type:complete len:395 (+) Transcript_859:73-1257(+)